MVGGHVLLIGAADWASGLAAVLLEHGFTVTLDRHPAPAGAAHLTMLQVRSADDLAAAPGDGMARPWIAVCPTGGAELVTAAYAAGALTTLPADLPPERVAETVLRALHLAEPKPSEMRRARLAAGDLVGLGADDLLTIEQGVVAQYALHEDGAEVLLGLWGAGEVVPGHPEDACCLELRAHTEVAVRVESWRRVGGSAEVLEGLRRRSRRLEAWSSMQARPSMEQRLSGILSLLAEQFGVPHGDGLRLDLRVTHLQLAAAVGANRATVTRILGRLRRRGHLSVTATGQRLVWRLRGECDHGRLRRVV